MQQAEQPHTDDPAAGGTDDLLAQMAGEEINRLLSQADLSAADVAPPSNAPSQPTPPPPEELAPDSESTHDPLSSRARLDRAAAADEKGHGSPEGLDAELAGGEEGALAHELDDVFERQMGEKADAEDAANADALAESSATPPPEPDSPHDDAAPGDNGDNLTADGVGELLGLLSAGDRKTEPPDAAEPVSTPAAASSAVEPPAEAHPEDESAALKAAAGVAEEHRLQETAAARSRLRARLDRASQWLLLPLDPFPDGVRDVIGKIAIITAVNAVALAIYLLLYR